MDNQEERLRNEILAESRKKAERLVSRAQREADLALGKAQRANDALKESRIEEAKAEATRQCRKIALDAEYERRRRWLASREECIDDVLRQVVHRAETLSGAEKEASYRLLARQAMEALGTGRTLVKIAAADAGLVTADWLKQIAPEADFEVEVSPEVTGGMVFVSEDGARAFDNTYAARMQVMHEEFRNHMAGILVEN